MNFSDIIWGDKSTKKSIVETLTTTWPLSLQKIYNEVRRKKSVSYQAVHKAISELLQSEILVKTGREYALNKTWISSLKDYSARLDLSYHLTTKGQKIDLTSTQFEFETMWEMYIMMLDTIEAGVFDSTNKALGACQFFHFYFWCPLLFSKKEYDQMKNIASNNKCYMVGNQQTALDLWIAAFYKELGWKIKTGVKCANPAFDTVVHGDTILQIFFEEELRQEMEKKLSSIKNISETSLHTVFAEVCNRKTKIVVLVHKNAKVAEEIHKQTRAFFTSEERYAEHR